VSVSELGAFGAWCAVATLMVPLAASADDQPQLEEIVVTGTRLSQPNFQSASPIVAVTADVFERTAANTAEATLNRYPQFVPTFTGTSNGAREVDNYSEGQASLDLRGLGASRTLTLVDGRRLVPVNGSGETDVNLIPPSLIERADIVTGGTSAVYGSDAIAGVVNLRLRHKFAGVEVSGRWGQTDRSDGEEYDVGVTAGSEFASGRGSIMGYVGYYNRAQINQGARDVSRATLYYLGRGQGLTGPDDAYVWVGSGATEEGAVPAFFVDASPDVFNALFESYGYPAGTIPQAGNWIGFNTDGTVFTMGTYDDPGSVANFRGQGDPLTSNDRTHGYNFANEVALQMPLDRKSAYLAANFEVRDGLELNARAIYADYTVNVQFAPTPLQAVSMPVTNPYIPADFKRLLDARPDPDAPFNFLKRMSAVGPRIHENGYDTLQFTVGANGRLPADWTFDAYVQHGESNQRKWQSGNISRSRVEELTYAPDGGVSICGGFNPFGLGSISPECARYVAVNAELTADVGQTIAEVSARGTIHELPAGQLQLAVGAQYRRDDYRYHADDALKKTLPDGGADIVGIAFAEDIDAEDHNVDLYLEAAVPLLADLPGARSLETVFGYRRSDYASAGGVDSWKAELLYQPVTPIRVRTSFQRAVRVPSIFELYRPGSLSEGEFFPAEPCGVSSEERSGPNAAQVEALCVAQGVPIEVLPDYDAYYIQTTVSGNPDLNPEKADTLTAGIIVEPRFESRWLSGLKFTIDWYQIETDDVVTFVDTVGAVTNCYDPRLNPGYTPDNYWCTLFHRDSTTGEIVDAVDTFRNLAISKTSGIDFQLDWQIPAGPGMLGLAWYVSWLDEFSERSVRELPSEQYGGTIGAGSHPEWKWLFDLRYTWRSIDAGVSWRYVDSMHDVSETDVTVPSRDYLDLDVSFTMQDRWFEGIVFRVGVENLTDEPPPIFPSWGLANTDPSQYDVLGRRFYVNLSMRF